MRAARAATTEEMVEYTAKEIYIALQVVEDFLARYSRATELDEAYFDYAYKTLCRFPKMESVESMKIRMQLAKECRMIFKERGIMKLLKYKTKHK